MGSPPSKKPKQARKRSKKYNDDKADLVLVSSDDVEFRVSSFYLKAASSVFRNLIGNLEQPANSAFVLPLIELTDKEIEASGPLEAFLDLFVHPELLSPPIPPEIRRHWLLNIKELILLVHKYDCVVLPRLIKIFISTVPINDLEVPKMFVVASQIGHTVLCHRLIKEGGRIAWNNAADKPVNTLDRSVDHAGTSCMDITRWTDERNEALPRPYFYSLLRALAIRRGQGKGSEGDWGSVADAFYMGVTGTQYPWSYHAPPL